MRAHRQRAIDQLQPASFSPYRNRIGNSPKMMDWRPQTQIVANNESKKTLATPGWAPEAALCTGTPEEPRGEGDREERQRGQHQAAALFGFCDRVEEHQRAQVSPKI